MKIFPQARVIGTGATFIATLFGACFAVPEDRPDNLSVEISVDIDVVPLDAQGAGGRATSHEVPVLGRDILVANIDDLLDHYGNGPHTFHWRRERNGESRPIGENRAEYRLGEEDFGTAFTVVAFDNDYNGGIISPPSFLITLPVTEEHPDINEEDLALMVEGWPDVKEELWARIFEDFDGSGESQEVGSYDDFFFQWQRSGPNGPEDFVPIAGGTVQKYVTKPADLGRYLRVVAAKAEHGSFLSTVFGPVGTHLRAGEQAGAIVAGFGGQITVPLSLTGFYHPLGNLTVGPPDSGSDLIITGIPETVSYASTFVYGNNLSGMGFLNLVGDNKAREGVHTVTLSTRTGSSKARIPLVIGEGPILTAGEPVGTMQAGVGGSVEVTVTIEGHHHPTDKKLTFGNSRDSGADLFVLGLPPNVLIEEDSGIYHAAGYGEGILYLSAGNAVISGEYTVVVQSSMGLILDTFVLPVHSRAGLDIGSPQSTIQENVGGSAEIPITLNGFYAAGRLTFGVAGSGADLVVEGLPANVAIDPDSFLDHNGIDLGTGKLKLTADEKVRQEEKQVTVKTRNGSFSGTFFLRVRPVAKLKIGAPEGYLQQGESGMATSVPVVIDGFHAGENLSFGTDTSADLQVTGLPTGVSVDGKSSLQYDPVRELGDGRLILNAAPEVKAGTYAVKIRSNSGNTEGTFDLLVYGPARLAAGPMRGTAQYGRSGRLDVKIDVENFTGRNGYLDFGSGAPSQIRVTPESGTLPSGIRIGGLVAYSNQNNSGSGDLTFFVDTDVPAGKYPLTVAFDDGRASTRIELQVRSLQVSQAYNHTAFQAGTAGTRTMPVSIAQYDGTGNLNFGNNTGELKLSGLPSGVTVTGSIGYDAGSGTGTGNLELSTDEKTQAGVYDVRMEFGNNSEVYGTFKLYVQELTITPSRPEEGNEGFPIWQGLPIAYDDPANLILGARFLHPELQPTLGLPSTGGSVGNIFQGLRIETIARFEARADGTGSGTLGLVGLPLVTNTPTRKPAIRVGDLSVGFTMTWKDSGRGPFLVVGPDDGSLNGVLTVTKGQGKVILPVNGYLFHMYSHSGLPFLINTDAGFYDADPSVFYDTSIGVGVIEEESSVGYTQATFRASGQLVLDITKDAVVGRHVFSIKYGALSYGSKPESYHRPEVIFILNVKP
ncbi:MAG: hypothetical protein FWD94_02080 [Treponema sp.]|nr:hypothetical protein [Treponema sp.]